MRSILVQSFILIWGLAGNGCANVDEEDPDATGGASADSGGTSAGGSSSGGATSSNCSNIRPTGTEWDEATCDEWARDTTECGSAWMVDNDYCNESCGRCTSNGGGASSGGAASGNSGGSSNGGSSSGGAVSTGDACDQVTPLSGGQEYCSSYQAGDTSSGFNYEIWTDTPGSGCMTVYGVDAAFKTSWSNTNDFLARVGHRYDETQTPDQIGTFSSDFAFTGSGDGLIYVGIYGWTNDPLIEYYIIEDWVNSDYEGYAPSIGTNRGTIEVDGGTYTVFENQRTGPSIHGDTTFTQFYSIRTEGRKCGHTSISEHFDKWAEMGMNMGKLYEVKVLVEGLNGSGSYDFSKATVEVE